MLLTAVGASAEPPQARHQRLVAAGRRLYREGVLPSGKALDALVSGDVRLSGAQAACVSCHRRSGMGSSEGASEVPPVTGPLLFQPRNSQAVELTYLSPRTARRPAYTDGTLARAISHGVDSAGVALAGPMPRYQLEPADMAALVAYLKTLGSGQTEGVTDAELHLATVVSAGVDPARRAALLDVLGAFIADKNAGTRGEARRRGQGPTREYDAYRRWRLHLWELSGPASTWRAQLESHARRTPVFLVLGGVVSGSFEPVHRFCEARGLPCLFPTTDLPTTSGEGYYTLYLSRGLALEGEVLARFLAEGPPRVKVVHQGEEHEEGQAAREGYRSIADARAAEGHPGEHAHRERGARSSPSAQGTTFVLWSRAPDLTALAKQASEVDRVFLSGTLLQTPPPVPERLTGKVYLVYPFALPEADAPQHARLRAFLRRKGLAARDTRVAADAFFASTVVGDALMRVSFNFSREYLIERIEDMLDGALTRSVYPRVSLGAGQRFASKGAYVVRLGAAGELEPVTGWMVP